MEANELMIGDWVFDKAVSDKPVQVLQINDLNVHYKHNRGYISIGIELLEPVKLTADILEKNHFLRYGKVNWHLDTLRTFCLENTSNPNDYKDIYWIQICEMMTRIEYVHQLQHALRLCRIDKEITL